VEGIEGGGDLQQKIKKRFHMTVGDWYGDEETVR
jgi:hypothetical protein